MTDLVTLRGLLGLPADAVPLSQSALVLVDCQTTYREGVMQLEDVEPALLQCQALLQRARKLGIPVVHIQHHAGDGSPYDVNAPIGQIAGLVAPEGNEPVVTKSYPNSFLHTGLHDILQREGAKQLVIAGFMAHMCISSTARAAFDLGYGCTVVSGACATRDLPMPDGSVVPAAQVKQSAMAALADLFAVVVADAGRLPD